MTANKRTNYQKVYKTFITKMHQPRLFYQTILCISMLATMFLLPYSTTTIVPSQSNITANQDTSIESTPQFNVDVIYAYTGPNNYSAKSLNGTMIMNGTKFEMHPLSLYPDIIFFNFTHVANAEKENCDAKTEVYFVEISTDTKVKENFVIHFGTNYNPKYGTQPSIQAPDMSKLDSLIDRQTTLRVSGLFVPNMGVNESLWFKIGTLDTTTSRPSGLGLWAAGEPHSITVKVHRIGWLSMTGNFTSVITASASDPLQVSLAKTSQGFLYNTIPEDDMLQTDAFHPIDLYKPIS